MSTNYLSCSDTAKLVRQALKEAFPDVKFSVRSKTYSGGASMRVEWLDGPSTAQVEAVACRFKGAYFDGSIDYKGAIYHLMDGRPVRFGADFIFCEREYSPTAVQDAIDRTYLRYEGNFKHDGIAKPTLEQFLRGELWTVRLSGLHHYGDQSVQADVNEALGQFTSVPAARPSNTANRVFVTHDDGYSRSNGSGWSAVDVDNDS